MTDQDSFPLEITVPIETAKKIIRIKEKSFTWCLTPVTSRHVPNAPDPDKEILGLRIDRTLKRRIEGAARLRGITITEFVTEILVRETSHISLSAKDYEDIARKVRKAEEKLNHRRG